MSGIFILLIFVLVFGLAIFLGALNLILRILGGIFSFGRKPTKNNQGPRQEATKPNKKSKLLFDKKEAEDADFEEIK